MCTKVSTCYYCGAVNGKVMKAKNFYGIIHRRPPGPVNEEMKDYKAVINFTPEIEKYLAQKTENPNPLNILNLFNVVSDEDLYLLNLGHNRPESYYICNIVFFVKMHLLCKFSFQNDQFSFLNIFFKIIFLIKSPCLKIKF